MALDVKIRDRKTGEILGFDHLENTGTAAGQVEAGTAAQITIIDHLAERILPLLAK